jgi:hypothetical protein
MTGGTRRLDSIVAQFRDVLSIDFCVKKAARREDDRWNDESAGRGDYLQRCRVTYSDRRTRMRLTIRLLCRSLG